MIRCVGLSVLAGVMCIACTVNAADLPYYPDVEKSKNIVQVPRVNAKAQKSAVKTVVAKPLKSTKVKTAKATREIIEAPASTEIDLAWVLAPLVATADGPRKEGSASVESNLVIADPGVATPLPLIIELSGHIVKTAGSTARLDVKIAGKNYKVTWKADEIKSGAFVVELNGMLPKGQLPGYIPVSALVFATKTSKGSVAMVSLEKVRIRLGNARVAQQ